MWISEVYDGEVAMLSPMFDCDRVVVAARVEEGGRPPGYDARKGISARRRVNGRIDRQRRCIRGGS